MTSYIGIILFPGFEDLDALGPKEALGLFSMGSGGEWNTVFVSQDGGPVRSFLGTTVAADHSFEDCPPLDVIVVPGGNGTRREMNNPEMLSFLQKHGARARYITSVCTGALVLLKAGFLAGRRATTHWGAIQEMRELGGGCTVVDDERWVVDGNVITAAGISAGIDMSLHLISLLKDPAAAVSVQQMMEYYPKPPVFEGASA